MCDKEKVKAWYEDSWLTSAICPSLGWAYSLYYPFSQQGQEKGEHAGVSDHMEESILLCCRRVF